VMTTLIADPAVLLAAIRATGGLPVDLADPRAVNLARRTAESAGRSLVHCTTGSVRRRTGGRGLVLGWLPQSTPAPEESHAYPVRNLTPVARLTWACCLGLAWPDRVAAPYPGVPFRRSEVVDVAGELGVSTMWVKTALFRTLIPSLLVIPDEGSLRLGPATAALPEPFVDAMRRFHDRLPRLQPRPAVPHDTELDDAELEDLDFDDDQDTRLEDETFTNEDEFEQAAYDDPWDE
jgi:hypothetical protein